MSAHFACGAARLLLMGTSCYTSRILDEAWGTGAQLPLADYSLTVTYNRLCVIGGIHECLKILTSSIACL